MGLLDQVVGALGGAQGSGHGGGQAELINAVIGMLGSGSGSQGGGLGELVARFQQGGLGDVVSSWISTGQNLPISAEQLQSVLGGGALQDIAAKLGVSPEQASGSLADLLPQVVDKLTPNGQVPEGGGDLLAQGLDMLKKGGLFS